MPWCQPSQKPDFTVQRSCTLTHSSLPIMEDSSLPKDALTPTISVAQLTVRTELKQLICITTILFDQLLLILNGCSWNVNKYCRWKVFRLQLGSWQNVRHCKEHQSDPNQVCSLLLNAWEETYLLSKRLTKRNQINPCLVLLAVTIS